MKYLTKQFLNDESGATAVEYGLIVALIAIAIVGGITATGTKVDTHSAKASANFGS